MQKPNGKSAPKAGKQIRFASNKNVLLCRSLFGFFVCWLVWPPNGFPFVLVLFFLEINYLSTLFYIQITLLEALIG